MGFINNPLLDKINEELTQLIKNHNELLKRIEKLEQKDENEIILNLIQQIDDSREEYYQLQREYHNCLRKIDGLEEEIIFYKNQLVQKE